MELPKEILKKVKLLEIQTRKKVNNELAGEYHSAFKGQGMTFSEFREYVPGDDVRSIAWSLIARTGKPHIKKYDEERELTLILVVDVSGSTDYGSGLWMKGEKIIQLCALLAFSAVKNKDHVGLLLFSDQVESYLPPAKGRGHVLRILRDLYYTKPKSHRTKISTALSFLQGVLKKRSMIFILSDFQDQGFESQLQLLGKKHEVISIMIQDPTEIQIPSLGLIELQDAETGEIFLIDSSSKLFQNSMKMESDNRKKTRDHLFKKSQSGRIEIQQNEKFEEPLIQYFKNRKR